MPRSDWKSRISGFKQTVCSSEGGDITQGNDIPLISFQCNIRRTCHLVLSFFFPSKSHYNVKRGGKNSGTELYFKSLFHGA